MTKSEKREFIKWNQSKMGMDGMYLKKVILPLLKKKAEEAQIDLSSKGRIRDFESHHFGSSPNESALEGSHNGIAAGCYPVVLRDL